MEKIWLRSSKLSGVPEFINPDEFQNINAMLAKSFINYAKDPCLVSFNTALSYKEVDYLSKIFAGYLQNELGLKKGERLAILMPNILQCPVIILAALRLGLIVVNIPFILPSTDINKLIKLTDPEVIVVFENIAPTLEPALKGISVKHIIVTELGDFFGFFKQTLSHFVMRHIKKVKACQIPGVIPLKKIMKRKYANLFQPVEIGPDDTALLQFTGARDQSLPKCVELTHRNLVANVMQTIATVSRYWDSHPERTALELLPTFRTGAVLRLFMGMYTGFQCVLIANPRDVDVVAAEWKRRPCSNTVGIQALFKLYLKDDKFLELDFSKLRLCYCGGVVSERVATQWKAVTGTMMLKIYSLTEATSVICASLMNTLDYRSGAGVPLPSTEIKVCDLDGNELPVNSRGELWVRGPQVMKGYWRDPIATNQVLTQDGWLKTGDIVVVDHQGDVTMIDRMADVLERSGKFTYSVDVENIIASIDGVLESVVICIRKPDGSTKIKAYVIKEDPELKSDTIMQICHQCLTEFCPDEIHFVESLPRSSIGYVKKQSLRERG